MIFKKKPKIEPSLSRDILMKYHNDTSTEGIVCKAPFTSLYFHPNGDIGACCLNYNKINYGNYPNQSIESIIKSGTRKNHQNYIENNNFTLGCDICQDNMQSEVFANLLATGYNNQNIKTHITRMDFELSYKCNLECVMCSLHSDSDKGSVYNDTFINEITPYLKNLEYTNFIGGEPFVIDIYYKIWERILEVNPNCIINIQTNGTIFNKRIKEIISNSQVSLVVSIDSLDEDRYAAIRKGGKIESTLKNTIRFNEAVQRKGKTLQLSVCPMRNNWIDIPQIIDYANNNDCIVYFNQVEYPIELSLKHIESKDLQKIIKSYKAKLSTTESNSLETRNKNSFEGLIKLLETWYSAKKEDEQNLISVSSLEIMQTLNLVNSHKYKDIFRQIELCLPEKWEISSKRYNEITNTDYNKKLESMRESSLDDSQILQTARNFFELSKTDNLYHE